MTSKPGRPRDERVESAIHTATLELIGEIGYGNVTMEAIAERADIAKPTLYSRYKSLPEIVVKIIDILDGQSVPAADTGSFSEDLIALLNGVEELLLKSPFGSILPGFVSAASSSPELTKRFHSYLSDRRQELGIVFRRAKRRGDLPTDFDETFLLDMLVGTVYFRFLIAGGNLQNLAEPVVDVMLNGIKSTN